MRPQDRRRPGAGGGGGASFLSTRTVMLLCLAVLLATCVLVVASMPDVHGQHTGNAPKSDGPIVGMSTEKRAIEEPALQPAAKEEDKTPVKDEASPVPDVRDAPDRPKLQKPDAEPDRGRPAAAEQEVAAPKAVATPVVETPEPAKPVASKRGVAQPERQRAVKEAFQHAWRGYVNKAWGNDDLRPISGTSSDWLRCGSTIIDALDTMWIMDLKSEFATAQQWVATELHFDKRGGVSFFEITIRALGGLLSAFDLSGERIFLTRAKELADRLMPAFNTPSGIPYTSIDLASGQGSCPGWTGGSAILSEIGTVQLEFKHLSYHLQDPKYANAVERVIDVLDKLPKSNGLYPIYVHPQSGTFTSQLVTLGALGDSFYEYLLKQWLFTGKTEPKYRRMYDETTKGIREKLVKKSVPSGLTYIAEWNGHSAVDKMDHLVCFAGAMFALGAAGGSHEAEDFEIGQEYTRTCWETYSRQATGIAPEMVYFVAGDDFTPGASHYILRPETVESFFVLWRLTHDERYREYGWKVFQSIEKYCRVPGGYSGIKDVNHIPVEHDDYQQSFFLAETLKYIYLLFSDDDLIPLDDWVFNTEAHPLRIWKRT